MDSSVLAKEKSVSGALVIEFLRGKKIVVNVEGLDVKELVKKVKLQEPINIDKINIVKDHYFSNAYIIDLPLDSTPDHAWQDLFEREWTTSRDLWERKLFVMGDKLRLIATTSQIDDKIDWVKQVIARTNEDVDEYNRVAPIDKQLKKQAFDEDKTTTEMIKEVLRKGFVSTTR